MITIPLNATVKCSDGDVGQSMYIIINPAIPQVTHLVVQKTELLQREIMVPINWVLSTTMRSILLDSSWEELEKRKTFIKDKFIKECDSNYLLFGVNSLYDNSSSRITSVKYKLTSPIRLIMSRKTRIKAIDGHIGSLDELVTNRLDGTITYLILGKGRFLGKEEVTIPVSLLNRFEVDTVHLKLNKQKLETLPSCKAWKQLLLEKIMPDLKREVNKNKDNVSQNIFYIHPLKNRLH
jgi:hypothetical protein